MSTVHPLLSTPRTLIVLVLLAAVVAPADAQVEGTWIGPMLGGALSITTSNATVYPGTPDCGLFSSGTATNWWAGAVFASPRLFGSAVGVRVRAGWGESVSTFETPAVDPIVLPGDGGTIVQATHTYTLEAREHRVRIEPAITFPLGSSFTLGIGASLDFSTAFGAAQHDRLDGGGEVLFDSGRTERSMVLAANYSAPGIIGGVAGIACSLPLGRRTILQPSVDLALGAGRLGGQGGLTYDVRGTVALLFNLGGSNDPDTTTPPPLLAADTARRDTMQRDTSGKDTLPAIDRSLNVAIKMYGEDAGGAQSSEAIVMLNEIVERIVQRDGDTVEHNSRSITPPKLRLQPTIHAGAGVRRWHIDLLYEGRTVGRYTDTGTVENEEVRWRISESEVARPASTLTAQLTAEDSLGTTATTQATLPIRFVRHGRILLRDSVRRLFATTLYPSEGDEGEGLSERDLDALDDFSLQLPSGTQVEVLLNSTENRVEGMRRARVVAEELRHLLRLRRAPIIQITSIDNRILGGTPPEGILFSRSVAVRATLPNRGER